MEMADRYRNSSEPGFQSQRSPSLIPCVMLGNNSVHSQQPETVGGFTFVLRPRSSQGEFGIMQGTRQRGWAWALWV